MTVPNSIYEAFEARASLVPDRVAIASGEQLLSYAQLQTLSGHIAQQLRRRGVGVGSVVGLFAERSAGAIAAILGILRAGSAYVPLDPSYPAQLLRFMYEDSAPSMMLYQTSLLQRRNEAPFWRAPALCIETDLTASDVPDSPDFARSGPEDLAYVMYTSGSTGRPKGVMVPHRAVLRLVIGNHFAQLDADQVLLQLAPLSFDASTFEIWGALLHGGTLAILSEPHPSLDQIAATIERHGVTTLWLTAGLFHLMVDHRLEGLRPLRQLLAGGDVLSPSHVEKALRALPECRIINGYGPTENTTFTCCYSIPRNPMPSGPIPIGTPIANTEVYILDEALRQVDDGTEGELCAGGAGLALGYLNRPELTAEKFIADPFARQPGTKLYRTGDRVRRRSDGVIEFLGRVDRQLKINGKRVELDEVENSLRRSGLVADAAVVPCDVAGTRRMVAFVTAGAAGPVDINQLRAFLRRQLPDYMVPSTITLLEALPLSPTGKVDRSSLQSALPSILGARPTETEDRSEVETVLIGIWREVLGTNDIRTDDNFFDLGGTSLQLIKAHAMIQPLLNQGLTMLEMFQFPSIRTLAARLTHTQEVRPSTLSARQRAERARAALARQTSARRGNSR